MKHPALVMQNHSSSGEGTSKESRTPVAWRKREHNLVHQPILQQSKLPRSPPSPNSTTTSTTATGDETSSEIETSESSRRRYNRLPPPSYARTNTLRSSRSVPALNDTPTWDGEPCPVHGGYPHLPPSGPSPPPPPPAIFINGHNPYGTCHYPPARLHSGHYAAVRKAGSLFDVRLANCYTMTPSPRLHLMPPPPPPHLQLSTPPPMIGRTLEKKSIYGSESSFHAMLQASPIPMGGAVTPVPPPYTLPPMPPPHLLPPGMRPRPLVIPAGVEPLPVRDPSKAKAGNGLSLFNRTGSMNGANLESKSNINFDEGQHQSLHCCKGPLPLIWFIICIVTMGVVLGVVLGSIYG